VSNETSRVGTETDADRTVADLSVPFDAESVLLGAGVLALAAVLAARLLVVGHSLPFDPLSVPPGTLTAATAGVSAVLGLSLVATGLVSQRAPVRVGLLFAGVFGTLALASPAATLPAVAGLVGGGAVAMGGAVGVPAAYREGRRAVIAAGFVAAAAVSLGSAVGVLGGGLRSVGGVLALAAVTATLVRVEGDRVALLAGAATVLAVAVASASSPFVLGSTLLVGFAVVGVPHVLAALAAGAGVAVAVAGLRAGRYSLVTGAGLLVLAGVPSTTPRAMALVLGAVLVLFDAETLLGSDADSDDRRGVSA